MQNLVVFWFRRDLRLFDNTGLYHALKSGKPVLPVFIFDAEILNKLNSHDRRVPFIYRKIQEIKKTLEQKNSTLKVLYGKPLEVFQKLLAEYSIAEVYTNHDYEPYARKRDKDVEVFLKSKGVNFHTFKDQVIFEKSEVVKDDDSPYKVFTPYSRRWKQRFSQIEVNSFPSENEAGSFFRCSPFELPSLKSLGFNEEGSIAVPPPEINVELIRNYENTRDFPAVEGTSHLGVHLRFGTVSIRELTRIAASHSEIFLNELIWRNFFTDILWHFPYVEKGSFKKQYDRIEWRNNEEEFDKWCRGETGYPFVDAGMRELNQTGFMHNRVRMAVASFLVKHLLIDWRWGEAYFAEKLLDFELASNNGNWQWAAGTGCDAAPYFRIFNPASQQKKFDKNGEYVRKWIPELVTLKYPPPVVDYAFARDRALAAYKKGLD